MSTLPPFHIKPLLLLLLFVSCILLAPCVTVAQAQTRPKALVAPVSQASGSSLYVMPLLQRTPTQQEFLLVDVESDYLWVDCSTNYKSSTYSPIRCGAPLCSAAGSVVCGDCYGPPAPGCNNNTCGVFISNSAIDTSTGAELSQDTIAIRSTDGRNPGSLVRLANFSFGCGTDLLLANGSAPAGVTGVAGLSSQTLSLPTQLAEAEGFSRKFAYCLPSSSSNGVIFFGDGPYVLLPGINVSTQLRFTPFLRNRGQPNQYYVGLKSISVDGKKVNYDSSALKIAKDGRGGTKITSTTLYTRLITSIYTPLRDAFIKAAAARGIKRVAAVKPFDVCFDASNTSVTRLGYGVPEIDLSLQGSAGSGNVVWQIFGASSVVSVSDKVFCLAFQDAGADPAAGIEVGTYQQQDHLLQFDLGASRLGFSALLLGSRTTCSNFNFTNNSGA